MVILNKHGQHETTKALIGLVLVSIIAFGMFGFMADLYKAMVQRKDPTIRSFEGLVAEINSQLSDRKSFTDSTYALSLSPDYEIVGFDSDFQSGALLPDSGGSGFITYYKPTRCLSQACICLYKPNVEEEEKGRDKNLIDCYTFGENTYISSSYYDEVYKLNHGIEKVNIPPEIMDYFTTRYAILFFKGKDSGYWNWDSSPAWNVQTLYVEKIGKEDADGRVHKNYIYLTVLDAQTAPLLDTRKKKLTYHLNEDMNRMLEEIKLMSQIIESGEGAHQVMIDLFLACAKYYDATVQIPQECYSAPECDWNPYTCMSSMYPCVYAPKDMDPMVCTENYFTYYHPDGCKPLDPVQDKGCAAPLYRSPYKAWQ